MIVSVVGFAACDLFGQTPPQNFNSDGPWNRDVAVYRVDSEGVVQKVTSFERAGVPTIARMNDGRLALAHQHFPENDQVNFDKVAVRFSSDEGRTWAVPQVIRVDGLPEGMRFPFDPTLVPLPDGRIRLYFTGNMGRTFGPSVPAIHSAISTDGIVYSYEPGMRFGVAGRMVIDCAVALHEGVFHLYVPDNGTVPQPGQKSKTGAASERPREGIGYHATSQDGLNFTRVDDVQIEGRRSWLGNAQSDGQKIIFYGTGEGFSEGIGGRRGGGLWIAVSNDGQNWKLVPGPVIGTADSGAINTNDGEWIVVGTGPPVRGPRANAPVPGNPTNR